MPRLVFKACREVEITPEEYENAKMRLVQVAPRESYGDELKCLKINHPLPSKSTLQNLIPFYDENSKRLRVGGRLSKAPVPLDSRFQIILPPMHHVTKLFAHDAHRRLWHAGQEHLMAQ